MTGGGLVGSLELFFSGGHVEGSYHLRAYLAITICAGRVYGFKD